MGGDSSQKSKQTTTTELPANQQGNIDQLLSGALDYYNSGGRNFFAGDTVADFDPLQTQGQNQLVNYANGAGQDLINRATSANDVFLDPNNIFNPSQIPGFQGNVDALTRGFTQNLTENILPSVRGGGTASGQFGGSATGIGEALSVERSNAGLSDSLSDLYLGSYGLGLDSFNQAQNRVPGLFNLGAAPGQITTGVGDARQNQEQAEIGGERERFEFGQNEQMILLDFLKNITGGAGQFGGTTTTEGKTTGGSGSPINQGLGGLMSLASLWGGGGVGGGLTQGAGTGGGMFGSGPTFSDRRLKQNIKRIGMKSGYPWYSFTIFGKEMEGVMADEVPEDFTQVVNGYLMVDYSRIL